MTQKNLKPQQTAPVQRPINTTTSVGGTGLTPLYDEAYFRRLERFIEQNRQIY